MNLVDTFLLASAVSYYLGIVLPKPLTKNIKPRWRERVFMFLSGTLLLANLLLNIQILWMPYGVLWTIAAGLSYLGYSKWNVLWKQEVSDAAQMAMWFWDLLIAICCFLKV